MADKTEPKEKKVRKEVDPELRAMRRMLAVLEDIEEPARRRVVQWMAQRYTAENGTQSKLYEEG